MRDAFKRAAEIASVVPETMHQAAFNRALDSILGVELPVRGHEAAPRMQRRRAVTKTTHTTTGDDSAEALNQLEGDRAQEVNEADGGQAKALALLLVAHRELGIDGLTAPQIAKVLTEKFRWRVAHQSIREALDNAGNRVDRVKQGRAVKYRIMAAGETWLAEALEAKADQSSGTTRPVRRRHRAKAATKAKAAPRAKAADDADGSIGSEPGKRSARQPSRGPKPAVEYLIDDGWFTTPRDLGAIRTELEHRMALRFKATDLSPTMTRLLRAGRLKRAKTEAGQYEYRSE